MLNSVLFVVCGLVTLVAAIATLMLSPKPKTLWDHTVGLSRVGVIGAVAFGIGDVLQTPAVPPVYSVIMVGALGVLYCAQARTEALRQQVGLRWLHLRKR